MTREKRNLPAGKAGKTIYWLATIWLSLGMVSTGIVQLAGMPEEVEVITTLGYPVYLLTILGVWKILGVVAVLLPAGRRSSFNLLKEWAYAGFFFAMSGAVLSHLFTGGDAVDLFGPTLLLLLTVVSWYFRPGVSTIIPVNP